ncbi:hypothetical protein SARC_10100 [Sphaeroforma arctica JP610]|uniref:Glucose-1-phosphate adenylyltransferase/Bifunctional protein GlmU-like C-terminal hexapeptide domain-containing protein n=1 Tax=Sphaeroforma arctica JP610 TaxID=667725 RepID=A0A0L0FKZ2_9EUKA|nr:hypothetical protein SARC_10100 [Sphaeroforma arctica JP610]KNC77440.1 hypothetical protein SARC_10100 [Sphaeroforma arctica JP610]|eukprot:XP_014151342.1 hypothetical protein SARC_10100 [Sphaeroforma arctica JP610]
MHANDMPDIGTRFALFTLFHPESSQLSDDSKIGDSCTVEGRVSIKNSTVGSHTTIRANVKLNNCVIMDHAEIGAGYCLFGECTFVTCHTVFGFKT